MLRRNTCGLVNESNVVQYDITVVHVAYNQDILHVLRTNYHIYCQKFVAVSYQFVLKLQNGRS